MGNQATDQLPNRLRFKSSETTRSGSPHAWAVAKRYREAGTSVTPGTGVAVGFEVRGLKELLANLAKMSKEARQKLERKAVRQALGPMYRAMKRDWKSLPVSNPSDNRARYWISKAVTLTVDRYVHSRSYVTGKAARETYGKVFISYKNKYRASKLAHLLENPHGNYRTSGPIEPTKLRSYGSGSTAARPSRKFGRMGRSYRVNHKVFQRKRAEARRIFISVTQMFLKNYSTSAIRRVIKGKYG